MGHLYFVRHGQTVWNVENKICGQTDSPLTELGHQQAIAAGEKVKAKHLHVDQILCSPLSRAYDTAKHIAEINAISLTVEPRLIEQNFGRWEGTPRDGRDFARAKQNFVDSYDGGESMLKFAHRIYTVLDEIVADSERVYMIVAHNGLSRVLQSYFFDMTNKEYAAFGIPNAEIKEYQF